MDTAGGQSLIPPTADVVIIGAGLAGLVAAVELSRRGAAVVLLEAADRPGGRIVTDLVDGFRLDRGFQLLNPAYPQLQRLAREGLLDLAALQLQSFDPGVRVALDGRHAVLADPRRSPSDALASLRAPLGSAADKARLAWWAARCGYLPADRLTRRPDWRYAQVLDQAGITGRLRTGVLEPFLAGVLGEDQGDTSANFVALLIRSFVRGTPAVPAWGMQRLPAQLAAALPAGTLHTGARVERIEGSTVHASTGSVVGSTVLIASDPTTAAELGGLRAPAMRSLTTFWFVADQAPCSRPILHVDGLRRGPVVNAAVLSAAAPAYSPDGRALVQCTIVGSPRFPAAAGAAAETLAAVRAQASLIFGTDTADWQLLRVDEIAGALPALAPPLTLRQPVQLGERLFVAGDHRDTASQQGALASGNRAARAIANELGLTTSR